MADATGEIYFDDSNGTKTYLGDMVTFVAGYKEGGTIRAGRVMEVTYRAITDDAVVKVSGRSQSIPADKLTRIDDTTLEGRLCMLVASCNGRIDADRIAEHMAWILANVNVPEEQGDGE